MPPSHTPSGLRLTRNAPDDGRPVDALLVHGIFAGAWCFDGWLARLAERGVRAAAVDLRGRPGSRPVADIGRVSLADYVDDVVEAATHTGASLLVGHSMGGLLVQAAAARGVGRAMALLAAAPPRGIPVVSPRLAWRQLPHLPAMLASRPIVGSLAEHRALTLNRMPPETHEAVVARFVPDSGRVARELSLGALRVPPAAVRIPTLVVIAGEDRFVVPRIGEALARRYGAAVRRYPEHAHFLVAEPGWEQIADEVAEWGMSVGALRAPT